MPDSASVTRAIDVGWLAGRWERALLRSADGDIDATSSVTWLQGPSLFVDLRRPGEGPGTGFAGTLTQANAVFTWRHEIELTPWRGADAGTLEWRDGHLVERGVHDDYLEHWRPARPADGQGPVRAPGTTVAPCWGLRLAGPSGQRAILVRVGDDVGWAQGPAAGVVSFARATGLSSGVITATSSTALLGAQLSWLDTVDCVLVETAKADRVAAARWQVMHREEAHGQPGGVHRGSGD
jgi:hypothetical protein